MPRGRVTRSRARTAPAAASNGRSSAGSAASTGKPTTMARSAVPRISRRRGGIDRRCGTVDRTRVTAASISTPARASACIPARARAKPPGSRVRASHAASTAGTWTRAIASPASRSSFARASSRSVAFVSSTTRSAPPARACFTRAARSTRIDGSPPVSTISRDPWDRAWSMRARTASPRTNERSSCAERRVHHTQASLQRRFVRMDAVRGAVTATLRG